MNKVIDKLNQNILKSLNINCVPVASIVKNETGIVSYGYNKKEKTNIPTDHAEIMAINKACSKLNSWRLDGCDLYVTLYPCLMCLSVAREARIKRIYYFVDNNKNKNDAKTIKCDIQVIKLEDRYGFESVIKEFFKKIR